MRKNYIETVMGAIVVVVALLFLVFAYNAANLKSSVEGYLVQAKFDRIDGIQRGSDIRMAGIKIGTVTDQRLDPKTYLAVVTMAIDSDVKLPEDTSAAITADGLLGDKYMVLTPGGAEEMIPPGGEITTTQGSIDLIGLVGKMIFSGSEKSGSAGGK